jgi:hypothetical protein
MDTYSLFDQGQEIVSTGPMGEHIRQEIRRTRCTDHARRQ